MQKQNINFSPPKIEFYKHNLTQEDTAALLEVMGSLFLTTGHVVKQFEEKFAERMQSKFAVGVMSCTHALELALRYFGVGPGDEVITTPLSFVATANAIEYVGATPIFVDVEAATGNIDVQGIKDVLSPRTKAILPVHLYGQMCDMKAIKALADAYGIKVIEDAAHCVEGERDGIKPGQYADAACYSFYATKSLACGEGGALTCNDQTMYEWLLQGRLHGMTKGAADRYNKRYEHYDVNMLGMKCNMSNMQASLLVHQMDRLEGLLQRRAEIVRRYDEAFIGLPGIELQSTLPGVKHAYHLYTILVGPRRRDEYLSLLQDYGIGVAVHFRPIHLMSYYRKKYGYQPGMFPLAEHIGASTITLPLYPKLTDAEISYIIEVIKKYVAHK